MLAFLVIAVAALFVAVRAILKITGNETVSPETTGPIIRPSSNRPVAQTQTAPMPPVKHKTVYVFGVTRSGKSTTSCKVCGRSGQSVFSNVIDAKGVPFRCCVWCFRKLASPEEVARASGNSKYVKRVSDCIGALETLRDEFPDEKRRPLGEKSLIAEIEQPYFGYDGIERIISKILERRWTAYDIARIEGTDSDMGE